MFGLLLGLIPDGMMIFYDGSQPPEGWEVVGDFEGRFPRACTPPGATGGSEKHTHGVPDSVFVDWEGNCGGFYGPGYYMSTECRDFWASITRFDSASHIPPFRYLLPIRKVGDGELLPKGAVLFFEDSVPKGWRVILPDSFPRAGKPEEVGKTGGFYYHTHVYELSGRPPWGDYDHGNLYNDETIPIVKVSLSDTFFPCESVSNLPPYITLYIAELTVGSAPLPAGAIAMFDEEPDPSYWVPPQADLSGRFVMGTLRLPGTTGGDSTHFHSCDDSLKIHSWWGDTSGCLVDEDCYGQYITSLTTCYYDLYWSFETEETTVLPPYRCVLFRKYRKPPELSIRRQVFYTSKGLVVRGYSGSALRLYSADGKLRLEVKLKADEELVDLTSLPPGVYFVKVGWELYKFSLP